MALLRLSVSEHSRPALSTLIYERLTAPEACFRNLTVRQSSSLQVAVQEVVVAWKARSVVEDVDVLVSMLCSRFCLVFPVKPGFTRKEVEQAAQDSLLEALEGFPVVSVALDGQDSLEGQEQAL